MNHPLNHIYIQRMTLISEIFTIFLDLRNKNKCIHKVFWSWGSVVLLIMKFYSFDFVLASIQGNWIFIHLSLKFYLINWEKSTNTIVMWIRSSLNYESLIRGEYILSTKYSQISDRFHITYKLYINYLVFGRIDGLGRNTKI